MEKESGVSIEQGSQLNKESGVSAERLELTTTRKMPRYERRHYTVQCEHSLSQLYPPHACLDSFD